MKGPGDFSPPEPENECPECGDEMEGDDRCEEFTCQNPECGHTEDMPEDPRISAAEDAREYGPDCDW